MMKFDLDKFSDKNIVFTIIIYANFKKKKL
jgi:hypothetical protein